MHVCIRPCRCVCVPINWERQATELRQTATYPNAQKGEGDGQDRKKSRETHVAIDSRKRHSKYVTAQDSKHMDIRRLRQNKIN